VGPGLDVGVSDVVMLPLSLGRIFLGETFTSYVIARNKSSELATNVVVKAELQMKLPDKAQGRDQHHRVPLSNPDAQPTAKLDAVGDSCRMPHAACRMVPGSR
jgi:hypothetical protein